MNRADGASGPGVVDQNINRAVGLQGLFYQIVDLILVGDIRGDGDGLLSQGSQLCGHLVDFFLTPGRQDDFAPCLPNARATERPNPLPAPVMIATLSCNFMTSPKVPVRKQTDNYLLLYIFKIRNTDLHVKEFLLDSYSANTFCLSSIPMLKNLSGRPHSIYRCCLRSH